ncbi:MAG: hypothetical protein QGG54_16810, partial [Gammaproteobacteria bacterium]|nr:hypothetical protein [Gammaproteobacteria bacterium]
MSKSDFRPTRAQAYTGFRDAPVWKIPQGVAYYCIAEYTSGAFSAPEKIAEMSIPSPEETDCGI